MIGRVFVPSDLSRAELSGWKVAPELSGVDFELLDSFIDGFVALCIAFFGSAGVLKGVDVISERSNSSSDVWAVGVTAARFFRH